MILGEELHGPVVATKLSPPALGRPVIPRPSLLARISDRGRAAFVVAPAGYGKSVLAEHWFSQQPPASAAWLSVDLIDGQPSIFWKHAVAALRGTAAAVDDEPLHLLDERGSDDRTFLAALCGQILTAPSPVSLVLDDLDRVSDSSVLEGLEFLVERTGGRLHLVATGRVEPRLPVARWRAAQRAELIDQFDLRFADEEASAFAATVAPGALQEAEVHTLNRQVEGWPIGLQLALIASSGSSSPRDTARQVAGTNRGRDQGLLGGTLIADYIVAEVLDALTAEEREVALSLSVLTWFDLDLCTEVAGADATRVVRRMRDRHLFLSTLDRPDTLRFHDLFRQLLEHELRWHDPARHDELHRRAATALMRRGERLRAYRHFLAVGDVAGAVDAVAPSMEMVDGGHAVELSRRLEELPDDLTVPAASQAIDLALAWYVAGNLHQARAWVDRAAHIGPAGDLDAALRIAVLRTMHALGEGDDDVVTGHHLETVDRLRVETGDSWPFVRRFVAVAARFAVVSERPDVDARLAELVAVGGPPAVMQVFVPAIEGTQAVMAGDLRGATGRADRALAAGEGLGLVEHPALMEAIVAAGHCALGHGDLDRAHALAGRAQDSMVWRLPWYQVRVGVLDAEVLRLRDGGPMALAAVDDLLAAYPDVHGAGAIGQMLGRARASALVACARTETALAVLDGLTDGPAVRILRGRALVRAGRYREVEEVLAPDVGWADHHAIEAGVLLALAETGTRAEVALAETLRLGARTGWVSPFLGHGDDLARLLGRVPVEDLHPALARVLCAPERVEAGLAADLVPLTPREQSLLDLLPTHLSNAQIGGQMHLSVNTVKTNLKALYRKLQVSSRSEAVAVATAAGLLSASGEGSVAGAHRLRAP